MKTRLLIIIAFVVLLIPLNLASGLPLHASCTYHDPRINLFPSKDEFTPDEPIIITVDTLHDDLLEVVAQNPQNLEVFTDVIKSDPSGNAAISIPTNNESAKGTWKIFVKSQSTESQEVVFVGVGQRAEPSITFNPHISNYAYGQDEHASFFVAGMPDQSLSVNVFDPYGNNMLENRVISIPSEGRCHYTLDVSRFNAGVYTVDISDKQEKASATFTVGIQTSTISEKSDELKPSDGIFSLYEKQVRYNIPYIISNGMIDDMTLFCEHGSLLIDVLSQSESDVNLEVKIPRNMLDPKTNGNDSRFFILRDGDEIDYDEIPYQDYRKLSMSFPPTTDKIEIIHAFVLALKPPMCKVADNPPYSSILPPLKQFKSGVSTDEIRCKEGLTMLLSPKDSRPVCVAEDTANKLIPRHWGILVSRG